MLTPPPAQVRPVALMPSTAQPRVAQSMAPGLLSSDEGHRLRDRRRIRRPGSANGIGTTRRASGSFNLKAREELEQLLNRIDERDEEIQRMRSSQHSSDDADPEEEEAEREKAMTEAIARAGLAARMQSAEAEEVPSGPMAAVQIS